jgi:hypothetical protein
MSTNTRIADDAELIKQIASDLLDGTWITDAYVRNELEGIKRKATHIKEHAQYGYLL